MDTIEGGKVNDESQKRERKEIRYFSMFTGVGGFELGIESASNRNAKYPSQEKNLSDSERNKSISEKQEEEIDNSTDSRKIKYSKDTSRTLFQNGQEQSNSIPTDLESVERNIEFRQQIRQTSDEVLRERDGIRDDSQSMGLGKDCTNSKQFQCVGFSEVDKYANQLLAKRFPNIPNFGDCTKINPKELPDFDMLCGGFPCQSFSIAGKRRGFEDTRGTMFFEVARILKAKRPKFVFLENVKGLLNHNKGETFKVIIQTLEELGYRTQWMVLNSKFFGVPQNRERVFIIGSLRGEPRPEILPFREVSPGIDERDIQTANTFTAGGHSGGMHSSMTLIQEPTIDLIQQSKSQHSRVYGESGISPTLVGASKLSGDCTPKIAISVLTPDRLEKRQNGRRFKEDGDESFTLTKTDIHGVSDGIKIRRLTPTECEFLQSFPKGWTTQGIQSFINLETYCKVNGTTKKTDSIKVLSLLQEAVGEKEGERWRFNEFASLLKDEILQPRLYEESVQIEMARGECAGTRRELQSKAIDYCNRMFSMWKGRKTGYAPQRQKQIEQLFEKLASALQKLPYQVASQGRWMEQGSFNETEKKFFGQIHTLIEFSDTQRYKMMGNAVTVNVIQAIASKLLEINGVPEKTVQNKV